mmetsp:Transcript_1809/g.4232  ORF Transcript_1809/g.4232 Transcript_1809/m.4232 type:complete len:101 (-) Transcript_1809:773-1075(-)
MAIPTVRLKSPLPYRNAIAPKTPLIMAERVQIQGISPHALYGQRPYFALIFRQTGLQSSGLFFFHLQTFTNALRKGLPLGTNFMPSLYSFGTSLEKNAAL